MQCDIVQLEKKIGKPQLPDGLDARREVFNASVLAMAKQLPPTDPASRRKTRTKSQTARNCVSTTHLTTLTRRESSPASSSATAAAG